MFRSEDWLRQIWFLVRKLNANGMKQNKTKRSILFPSPFVFSSLQTEFGYLIWKRYHISQTYEKKDRKSGWIYWLIDRNLYAGKIVGDPKSDIHKSGRWSERMESDRYAWWCATLHNVQTIFKKKLAVPAGIFMCTTSGFQINSRTVSWGCCDELYRKSGYGLEIGKKKAQPNVNTVG